MRKKTKLVYGVGVNDADYAVQPASGSGKVKCHYYHTWKRMLERCYSVKRHEKHPTYKGCSVCDEWLSFISFRSWMIKQDWEGKELDKDLLTHGNKVYSPANCMFVSNAINKLFTDSKAKRGDYVQGVCFDKHSNNFKAQCSVNGKTRHLGVYKTEAEAREAYIKFKVAHCLEIAEQQTDDRLKQSIIRKANELCAK